MATYLLVHGAWHGGWCWKKLTPLLCAAGHEVFTPTLTGLGERSHLLTPTVDLDTHVQDILKVMEYEDLRQVVLVGHSYAGVLIPLLVEQATDRIVHAVYLDAVVVSSGQSIFDRYSWLKAGTEESIRTVGEGWRIPPPDDSFGVKAQADVHWLKSRLTAHPAKTLEQQAQFTRDPRSLVPCLYISCSGDSPPDRPRGTRVPEAEGMDYEELATGHDAMISAPRELADLLLKLV